MSHRTSWAALSLLAGAASFAMAATAAQAKDKNAAADWQDDFGVGTCKMLTSGRSDYFVLEPGYMLVLQEGSTRMEIKVLDETREVAGVTTRVVEEREWDKGKLHEVSRNYYAMCESTKDVIHFGEDVQHLVNGKVVKTEGTWIAGVNGNRPGLVVAGTPTLKHKYYQEIAPGVSMNRGEIVSLSETCKSPAGTFTQCMKVRGTSTMDARKVEYKYYAPNIGLVQDESLRLVKYGAAKAN
jgi:hypothetical protein